MSKGNDTQALTADLRQAVYDIKTAILQGQYEASKGVNRIQLAVYFGIGKYVSQHSRKGTWGTGALDTISGQLRRELPGLRGYSASSMKNMRKFYENWSMLDSNPASALAETLSVATDELESTFANVETTISKSTIANVELLNNCPIDIYHSIQIPDIKDFPVEDFFRLPFSHHIKIIEGCKDIQERYYFIHRAVEENVPSDSLPRFIKNNPSIGIMLCKSANREYVEFMIRDYSKPMGVATYKTADEMPEHLRKALPSQEELIQLMERESPKND